MRGRSQSTVLIASLAALVAGLSLTPVSNNDIWLHLRTGALILERGAVPRVEEYTFTRAGRPVVDHEWLAQALFAAVHGRAGLNGLAALKLLLTCSTMALVLLSCIRATAGRGGPAGDEGWSSTAGASTGDAAPWETRSAGAHGGVPPGPAGARGTALAALTTAAASLLVGSHLYIRPHLFTYLLAAAFATLLPRLDSGPPRARRTAFVAVLGLQILWANLHGGFVVGPALAAVYALGRTLEGRGAWQTFLAAPALLAVSVANPYGIRIYGLVAEFADSGFRELVVEWKSPFRAPFAFSPLFWLYLVWMAAVLGAVAWFAARRRHAAALTALAFAALSADSRRHVSLFAIVTAPLLAEALSAAARSAERRRLAPPPVAAGWSACAVLIGLAGFIWSAGLPWDRGVFRRPGFGIAENIPVEALEVVRAERLEGRVFASMAFAGYVTYGAWPRLTTYIDSRLEIFGGPFIREYDRAGEDPAIFSSLAARERFDFALLSWQLEPSIGAAAALAADPGWALIYFDDLAMLYVRRDPAREDLLSRRAFKVVHPLTAMAGSGIPEGADPAAVEREARRAVEEVPSLTGRPAMNAVARLVLAGALQRQGRHVEAASEIRAALAARPNATVAYGMLAISLMASGDRDGARQAAQELKRRVPGSRFADEMLREIGAPP